MSHKFQAEDFYDAINSIGALGSFPHDLGDYFIRNSGKYKEACHHLHKDMLEQKLLVVDMDSLPAIDKLHPFKLNDDEVLIALQSDKPNMKRMLSITRYESPECDGETEEMIIVPLIAGQQKHQWNPVGIVIFLREMDDPEKMEIRTQEFPGAIVGNDKIHKLAGIVLDAVNIIATVMNSGAAVMTEKEPSKLKLDRAKEKDANIVLKPFTLMHLQQN